MGIFKGSCALALPLNRRPRGFPEQAKSKWEIKLIKNFSIKSVKKAVVTAKVCYMKCAALKSITCTVYGIWIFITVLEKSFVKMGSGISPCYWQYWMTTLAWCVMRSGTLTKRWSHWCMDSCKRFKSVDYRHTEFKTTGIAPLLKELMADYAATGLPPAYLPKHA